MRVHCEGVGGLLVDLSVLYVQVCGESCFYGTEVSEHVERYRAWGLGTKGK